MKEKIILSISCLVLLIFSAFSTGSPHKSTTMEGKITLTLCFLLHGEASTDDFRTRERPLLQLIILACDSFQYLIFFISFFIVLSFLTNDSFLRWSLVMTISFSDWKINTTFWNIVTYTFELWKSIPFSVVSVWLFSWIKHLVLSVNFFGKFHVIEVVFFLIFLKYIYFIFVNIFQV